ncbi:MAG: hypothetical protein WC686_04735 [Candidatus Shapirobacteria bacterium]|jgi:hypothetical protein
MKNKGQGLVELLLSVTIIVLVTTGVVALMVKTLANRNRGFDRNKASRLGTLVLEDMVKARSDPGIDFFGSPYSPIVDVSAFVGYTFTYVYEDRDCGVGKTCIEGVVRVGWSGSPDQVEMKRLFYKY